MNKYIVITTINHKSEALSILEQKSDWKIVVVGDKKTPMIKSSENLIYLSIEDQKELGYNIVKYCPYNHYARKNIGYLYAIQQGAEIIYDTDDDNWPGDDWQIPDFVCEQEYLSQQKFVNIYRYFTDKLIWPRGYPLDEIKNLTDDRVINTQSVSIGVWQGLVDLDPDVDAIYRLTLGENIVFEKKSSVFLNQHRYCPFNSQNTFWHRDAFAYLYLPVSTSFRFTDILRGYIAQRLMWNHNLYLGFQSANVYQKRNPHDLMQDFQQEIECYLGVKGIITLLEELELETDILHNLEMVYKVLKQQEYVKDEEVLMCQMWLNDLRKIMKKIDSK